MLKIIHAEKTSVGKVRELNEDAYGVIAERNFFFVCDGMGGHAAGDFASRTAVTTIRTILDMPFSEKNDLLASLSLRYPTLPDPIIEQAAALLITNRRLFMLAVEHPHLRGMGTTIVSLSIAENAVYTLHAGDSRVYCYRTDELIPLTADHSWVNELLEDKEISHDEARQFKKKNIVTRVLGTQQTAKIDCAPFPVKTNDCFLLCSDGLTGPVGNERIASIMKQSLPDLKRCTALLTDAAYEAGAPDNVTVVLVRVAKASVQAPSDVPERSLITIDDNEQEYLEIEDRTLKKTLTHQDLIVPEDTTQKSSKSSTPAYVIIGLLTAIFIALSLIIFQNIKNHGHENYKNIPIADQDTDAMTGYVEIVSSPPGAAVYLNNGGIPIGISPLTIPFKEINPAGGNVHTFTVKKKGYGNAVLSREVIPRDTVTVAVTLSPESILELYLAIDAQFPDSACVCIEPAGAYERKKDLVTINQLKNIAFQDEIVPGEYELTVEHEDTNLWEYRFSARAGQKTKIYISTEKGADIIQHEKL